MKRFPWLARFLFRSILVSIALISVYWVFENWKGGKEWKKAQARVADAGVSLKMEDYRDPVIPLDEDLLLEPVFMAEFEPDREDALGDWVRLFGERGWSTGIRPQSGESLEYRKCFEGGLSEEEARAKMQGAASDHEARLRELSRVIMSKPVHRVFARETIDGGVLASNDHIDGIQKLTQALYSSALMAMRNGDAALAIERIKVIDQLSRISDGPTLLDCLVANALEGMELTLIWEGVRMELWSLENIGELESLLVKRNLAASYTAALKYEMALSDTAFESPGQMAEVAKSIGGGTLRGSVSWWGLGGPRGWTDRRKAITANAFLDVIEMIESKSFADLGEIEARLTTTSWSPLYLASMFSRTTILIARSFQREETRLRIARICLALEKWKIEQGRYPGTFKELGVLFAMEDLLDPQKRELANELGPDGRPQIWSKYAEENEESEGEVRWQFWAEEK